MVEIKHLNNPHFHKHTKMAIVVLMPTLYFQIFAVSFIIFVAGHASVHIYNLQAKGVQQKSMMKPVLNAEGYT